MESSNLAQKKKNKGSAFLVVGKDQWLAISRGYHIVIDLTTTKGSTAAATMQYSALGKLCQEDEGSSCTLPQKQKRKPSAFSQLPLLFGQAIFHVMLVNTQNCWDTTTGNILFLITHTVGPYAVKNDIASEASYGYILSGPKLIKNAPKTVNLASF